MIRIKHKDNKIFLEPETVQENQFLVEILSKPPFINHIKNEKGTWLVNDSLMEKLGIALIPVKKQITKEQSMLDFVNSVRQQKTTSNKPLVYNEDQYVDITVGVVNSFLKKRGFISIDESKITEVTRFFSVAAVNCQSYKDGKWDGYVNLYDKRSGKFPTGLLGKVLFELDKQHVKYNVFYKYEQDVPKKFSWHITDNFTADPDQLEAIKAGLNGKRGIIKAPTAFGKTAILAKRLTASFGVPTLFIANKKSLLDDAAEEFSDGIADDTDVNIKCGQIKDGWFGDINLRKEHGPLNNALNAPVLVATIQSLAARLSDDKTKPYLLDWLRNTCKFVMVDECQAVGTRQWETVLNECWAPYRICLSATPRRTDGASIKIEAASGPVLFTTTAEKQIEQGRLCELEINYLVYDHKIFNDEDSDIVYSDAYQTFISENTGRNEQVIIKPTLEMLEEGRHVLVLISRIEHGHILEEAFINHGIKKEEIRFVWGDTPDKMRDSAISEFRKGEFKIMIGSTIFDAGVNIPIISGVVLGGAGNSDITLIQRIGRGARNCNYEQVLGYIPEFMQRTDHKVTKVYDTIDKNVKFFHKQSINRYHNACDEFGKNRVHILGEGVSALRKTPKASRTQQYFTQADMAALEEFKKFVDGEK